MKKRGDTEKPYDLEIKNNKMGLFSAILINGGTFSQEDLNKDY